MNSEEREGVNQPEIPEGSNSGCDSWLRQTSRPAALQIL